MTKREAELQAINILIETAQSYYDSKNWFKRKFNREVKDIPDKIKAMQDYKKHFYGDLDK